MPTTFLTVKNRATSTLNGNINSSVTSLAVAGGDGVKFPSTYPFHITIDNEILEVSNVSTNTLTVTRAAEGTTNVGHTSGAVVSLNITTQMMSDLNTAVNTLEGKVKGSTVLKALTEIQMVPADIVSVTTCTSNATFYEPAIQDRLTSDATYKRYVALKCSVQSNTTGTVTLELYNFTTSAQLRTVAITVSATNTETVGAATTTTIQVTNLSDVVTIRIKHSVNGATVKLDSGGIMEADGIKDVTSNTSSGTCTFTPSWLNAWKYYQLAGLSTAASTVQPTISFGAPLPAVAIGSSSNTLNASIAVGLTEKLYYSSALTLINSGLTGQVLLGQAFGLSVDNI